MVRLQLTVVSGHDLAPKDFNGKSDPYVKFHWRGQKYKTSVKKKTLNPSWGENFVIEFDPSFEKVLRLEIWDYDRFRSNDPMGKVEIDLETLECLKAGPSDGTYAVQSLNDESVSGKLRLSLQLLGQDTPQIAAVTPTPTPAAPAPTPALTGRSTSPTVQQGGGAAPPPGYTDTQVSSFRNLQGVLPHCNPQQIWDTLCRHNFNQESALDDLLKNVSTTTPTAPSPSPVPPASTAAATAPSYTVYINTHTAAPAVPPQPSYGFAPAPSYVPPSRTAVSSATGKRRALFVGINYYGSRQELKGCVQDVYRMKDMLVRLYGFQDHPCTMVSLTDDAPDPRYQPTRHNIIYAMQWLVMDARPGDVFFFHFSGHGSQVRDRSGMEEDGLDETILPVDFRAAGQIVDDEIHRLLVQSLPQGCRMTSVMDCCHSGTGMDLPFSWDMRFNRWQQDTNPFFSPGDIQLFSGCEDHQVAADIRGRGLGTSGGAMTMAFISALTQNPFGYTYPSLMAQIRKGLRRMGQRQLPQLSSTQPFAFNRPFNLTDIVPNHNQYIGRQVRRKCRRRHPNRAGGMMLAGAGGLAAGLLLGELLS